MPGDAQIIYVNDGLHGRDLSAPPKVKLGGAQRYRALARFIVRLPSLEFLSWHHLWLRSVWR